VNPYNYLVVEDGGSLTLVDTGMSKDGKKVLDYVRRKVSTKLSSVKTIVLTHCHIPYVRGAFEIRKRPRARDLPFMVRMQTFCLARRKCRHLKGQLVSCSESLSLF
jgi:glyoxylase-like metal-dependent hydrolase (beta-lactamase superfamily II)